MFLRVVAFAKHLLEFILRREIYKLNDKFNENESKLTKMDLLKSWFIWATFAHSAYSYERLQGPGFAHTMTPIIKRLYTKQEDISAALKRHLAFFNTDIMFGSVIPGIVIAMEEQKAKGAPIDGEAINSVKAGLMGPLAGIGDSICQGAIIPILLSIGIGLGLEGNIFGPIIYTIAVSAVLLGISYVSFNQGYKSGNKSIENLLERGILGKIISGAGVLGCMVMGTLTANYVNISTPIMLKSEGLEMSIQTDVLDKILPGLLPLLITLGCYKLLSKGVKPTKIILIILVVGILGSLIGLF